MATVEKTVYVDSGTNKPNGLTIKRDGLAMTISWKIVAPDHRGGQQLQWRTNLTSWENYTIATSTTSITIYLSSAAYYPNKDKYLKWFQFRIRGKREQTTKVTTKTSGSTTTRTTTITNYDWSKWNDKTFYFSVPNRPTLTAELDSAKENETIFTWATETSNTDGRPFHSVWYQTMRIRGCKETDGSKLTWGPSKPEFASGSVSGSSSMTIKDDLPTTDSYTRWFRVRSRGARGVSNWRYAKHVYATPNTATITKVKSSVTAEYTTIRMTWTAPSGAVHPIDYTVLQWLIYRPEPGRVAPSTGVDWNDAVTLADAAGSDTAQFLVDQTVGLDQCLWVRVKTVHDKRESLSARKLVRSGRLTPPEDLTVVTNSTYYRAEISATNKSEVPDSKLAVVMRREGYKDYVCGIITPTTQQPITVQCAEWSDANKVSFGVYAFQGTYSSSQRADGKTQYAVNANMTSNTVWGGGVVPAAPASVTVTRANDTEALVRWLWTWSTSNRAEVSWSQNPNAWESNVEPESYLIPSVNPARLRVSNLQSGTTWYFRVRLAKETENGLTYGPYSDLVAVDLASAPNKPSLALSAGVVTRKQKLTISWNYSSTDGTEQSYAEVRECTVEDGVVTYGTRIAKATTAKSVTVKASRWAVDTTVYLAVRVTSGSGIRSEWSDPVPVTIAPPVSCVIASTSLETVTVTDDEGHSRTVTGLTELPLEVTVTGAGEAGTTMVTIERAEDYRMDRPDDGVFNGFNGETVVSLNHIGEDAFAITQDDLIGYLDDGAAYRLTATVQDSLGQSATATQEFEVHWSHQAIIPSATVQMDTDNMVAMITPTAPTGTATGDVCDIYRLSADKPELIVQGGTWGTTYVDPYPALGEYGGHRVVFRTANGDYITADNHPAWIDLGEDEGDRLESKQAIIDFDGNQLRLTYNVDVSYTWSKDFQETKYLGGAVQGDWNPAVSRTGNIGTVSIKLMEPETIRTMRKLAIYTGICHVRTPDGSSFAADVQVTENRDHNKYGVVESFTLGITRVDPEGMDGLTYDEWIGD